MARDDCLRHVVTGDADDEVAEVVRLILEHARTRPSESLGVIALGMRHAERIDAALRAALSSATLTPDPDRTTPAPDRTTPAPDLEAFFAEDVPEPFFVKNLERVQGDERDAIIMSVGYGKHSDGRMRYQWGPLLRDGGERRLNVAATRAKRRLTVVSSFSSHDVDPARLVKPGARLLAEYLEYAGSGGTPVAASGSGAGLEAFEADVVARLAELGITVVPQYGVGGYRVDFAAAHPDDPSLMILAVEADGASYRDSGSVRDRDRLRKEHLERLGWRVHRLWSTSWFTDPDAELAKLRAAYREAVQANPPAPPPPPETAPPTPAGEPPQTPRPPAGQPPQLRPPQAGEPPVPPREPAAMPSEPQRAPSPPGLPQPQETAAQAPPRTAALERPQAAALPEANPSHGRELPPSSP